VIQCIWPSCSRRLQSFTRPENELEQSLLLQWLSVHA
jgi:hypothetical protein